MPRTKAFTLIKLLVVVAIINRHNGFINGVFLDVSVRPIGRKELWELHWHRQWATDRVAARTPVWPEWMRHFQDYRKD